MVSAASYVFAIGLYMTAMAPMGDPNLGIGEYFAFYGEHRAIVFVWTYSMYIIHGGSLIVLVLALRERLKEAAPRLSLVAAGLGFAWAGFVLLSGFINLWGAEALADLHPKNPGLAETLKEVIAMVTLGIDSSDKCLGALWIGLSCLAALTALKAKAAPKALPGAVHPKAILPTEALPKALAVAGLGLGAAVFALGLALPANDPSASFAFGIGTIFWWLFLGLHMLRRPELA
ncbi:MAG: hypothetical protein FD137_1656 [Spirochaetes bacterium]|nr:MAG: hypothetical protein FD137_1656 [Spirochaetota bacterium]